MTQTINYALQILTVCQGVWVITLMAFLMWHYIMKSMKNRYLEKNAFSMGISYSCLTIGTMLSSMTGVHNWDSTWQIIVIIGYFFGDIAIVKMLFHITRNERTKRAIEKHIIDLKKNPDHK